MEGNSTPGQRRLLTVATTILAAIAGLCLALRVWRGFYFLSFGDETEHLIGAKVIMARGRLYHDFIDEHGPLPYALAQAFGAVAGWEHPTRARVIPALLALAAMAAMAGSRALQGCVERLTAAAMFAALIASIWIVQGLCFLDYQPLAGMILVIATASFTAPAWADEPASRLAAFIGGACCVLACFVAYAYGPAAVLLFGSGVWAGWQSGPGARRTIAAALAGACLALAAATLWLALYANLLGYLAFHFIRAQIYFGPYLNFSPLHPFAVLIPGHGRGEVVQTMGIVAAGLAVLMLFGPLLARRWRLLGPALAAMLALILTNPRGSPIFQNATFVVLAFGWLALAMARLPRALCLPVGRLEPARVATVAACVLGAIAAEAAARHATSSPHGLTRSEWEVSQPHALGLSQGPWAVALRRATKPDERFLALPFDPDLYFEAGRLPMRGYYDYLPWNADYAKSPWFGQTNDLCVDLQRDPPPVLFYNGWVVWDRYDPRNYMPCVLGVIAKLYVPAPATPDFFVRRDRVGAWLGK